MTITLLRPDGLALTAQQHRQGLAPLNGGGSGRQLGGRSGFRVGTSSTVLSATSTTWTLGPCAAMIDPGATAHQGMYGWASDANITGTVTASDATNPRKDIIYIQVNDSSAGDGSGAVNGNVYYLAGVADGTNVAPALPARSFLVATLSVPPGTGTTPTVVVNPARYVAAGAPLPVVTDAERDALTKFTGLQVLRTDKNGRIETWNGTVWWWIGQSWSFNRGISTDSTFATANTGLVSGTITAAPAGTYRIEAHIGLYGSSSAVGRTYVMGASTQYKRRQDLTGTPSTYYVSKADYVHAGGNLTITAGYDVTSGTASVMSAASGETTVTATLIGA